MKYFKFLLILTCSFIGNLIYSDCNFTMKLKDINHRNKDPEKQKEYAEYGDIEGWLRTVEPYIRSVVNLECPTSAVMSKDFSKKCCKEIIARFERARGWEDIEFKLEN